MLFIRKSTLKGWLNELLGKKTDGIEALLEEAKALIGPAGDISAVKRELAELKLEKEMTEREIKHLVKMKEEKLALEWKTREVDLEKGFQLKEMELRKEYHDKILDSLNDFQGRQDKLYEQIMKRLPNVEVLLGDRKMKKDE